MASAQISLPQSGFAGDINNPVQGFPVSIVALDDGHGHTGLVACQFAVSFPKGVFNFPIGGELASSYIQLGDLPENNGASGSWTVTANSPQDGVLNINLSLIAGQSPITDTAGGSLLLINFPVFLNPSTPTPETITISFRGPTGFHSQVVGTTNPPPPYVTAALGLPVTGVITINPV